ncbi:helix-turn-helix domain-containing protein [Mucilaginibacter sp. SG564]|uniref:helix-turn-helix domain-containing protein n=1 Tax=Mucilaginibacter sp. SG564 TaxID=2587022 RepID=UPI0015549B6F|nr:helix-turn-helix transcriptional regulator [Mucilaginibacter sp. SG564]NOW99167.1 transcriptional regulator with XRE-family HTH domain [Mucilaginibacter sp. SG564]
MMMTFGNRLTSIRKERKVSQSDLGIKAGVHANLIGRYERDEALPSVEVAGKIADALSVSLDYLVGKADKQIDQTLLDKVLSIQQLPDEDREHIMYAIDGLIQHAKTKFAYKK